MYNTINLVQKDDIPKIFAGKEEQIYLVQIG